MKILLVLFTTFISVNSFANDAIKNDMKQIGALFKQIATTMNDPSKNASNAAASSQIVGLFADAIKQEPDSILKLPVGQQSAAVADYRNMISQESNLTSALAKAFSNNDNNGAAKLLQQMSDLKKEGHDKFNPQN